MKYEILDRVSKKANVSLLKFYMETNISYKTQKEMRENDFIPSYIRLMLMSFMEKEIKTREKTFLEQKKKFFNRARGLGFKEEKGYIVVPLFGLCEEIEISDFESQFVRFTT